MGEKERAAHKFILERGGGTVTSKVGRGKLRT
jgi:hypothetical protein